MAAGRLPGIERAGWHLVLFPAFRATLLKLASEVARLKQTDPDGALNTPRAKLLKRILDIILDEIPRDPAAAIYEQGNTLGADARGWRRAKFWGRFRLFFRFDSRSKVIVYAWVNDENTLREAGSASDPYVVFRAMLVAGNPPHDWDNLMRACATGPDTQEDRALEDLLGPAAPAAKITDTTGKPATKRRRGRPRG